MPNLQLPVDMRVRKTAGCCFSCISGTIVAAIALPKTGFCVDEDIPYHITIENGGSLYVEAAVLNFGRAYRLSCAILKILP